MFFKALTLFLMLSNSKTLSLPLLQTVAQAALLLGSASVSTI